MSMNNTLNDYQDFVRTFDDGSISKSNLSLPEFKVDCWQFSHQSFTEATALNTALKQLELTQGWLTLPSQNLTIDDYDYNDQPLSGQACNAHQSIQLNWYDQLWQLVIIETGQEASDSTIEGLVCHEKQLAKSEDFQYLYFESLWQNIEGAMRKTATRFTGVQK